LPWGDHALKNTRTLSRRRRFFVLIALLSILTNKSAHPVQSQKERYQALYDQVNTCIHRSNQALALAYSSNETSIGAYEGANKVLDLLSLTSELATKLNTDIEGLKNVGTTLTQQAQSFTENLVREYDRLSAALSEEVAQAKEIKIQLAQEQNDRNLEEKIQLERARIHERHQHGIYEMEEKIRAKALVKAEETKWNKIHEIVGNPKTLLKIALAITVVSLSVYAIKYGIPALINYFSRPYVISETSKAGWFEWQRQPLEITLNDFVFHPSMEKQLFNLAERIKSAQMYNENLPNILFYGAPGTGKSAFAKALAYHSGLDYAITSGSEFAKITNLNDANNELRNLLNWGKNSSNGLIIFIDETESLFANKKLQATSKLTQDFINTFLSLIPDASQKNVMFIFATNHPFKLDDAITSRIGINIEFPLPEAPEREKILTLYLEKFALENEDALVAVLPEVLQALPGYADSLDGLSPRAIKFVAEEMIIAARRQAFKQLTNDLAQKVLNQAKQSLQETLLWEKERNQWINNQIISPAIHK